MNQISNLKKLEKQLYLSYSKDGLADLLMGLWLSLAGLLMLVSQPAFIGLAGLPILFYLPLKKKLIVPRMGDVQFSKERKKKISNLYIFLIITGVMVLIFVLLRFSIGPLSSMLNQQFEFFFGMIIALLVCTAGLVTGAKRFFLYALIALIVFAVEKYIVNSIPITLLSFGILLLLVGIVMLSQYLIKNPVISDDMIINEEVSNEQYG